MQNRANYALTPAQADNLGILLRAGATSREEAVSSYASAVRGLNPNVLGILREKGMVMLRVKTMRPGGSRATVYWLTDDGVACARQFVGQS